MINWNMMKHGRIYAMHIAQYAIMYGFIYVLLLLGLIKRSETKSCHGYSTTYFAKQTQHSFIEFIILTVPTALYATLIVA